MKAAALVLALVLAGTASAGEDFPAIFGSRYDRAAQFLAGNGWIERELRLPAEDRRVALAVVFPELIRYGALEDGLEVRALKVLYVQYGQSYANFSIGRFQMKPSFAEQLEADAQRLLDRRDVATLGFFASDLDDTSAARERRVRRLDDLAWQVRYLRLFMLVMAERYCDVRFAGADDRARFYATAYNAGYAAGEAVLRQKMRQRRFHTALVLPGKTYCYADVAAFYFARTTSPCRTRLKPCADR